MYNHSFVFDNQKHIGYGAIVNISTYFIDSNDKKIRKVPFCKVKLFDQKNNAFLKYGFSSADGTLSFNNLDLKNNSFFIVAHDPAGKHNAVAVDNIGGKNVDN